MQTLLELIQNILFETETQSPLAHMCETLMFQLSKQYLTEENLPPGIILTWVVAGTNLFPSMEPNENSFTISDLKELKRDSSCILSKDFDYANGQPTKLNPTPYQCPQKRRTEKPSRTTGTQTERFEPSDWFQFAWKPKEGQKSKN